MLSYPSQTAILQWLPFQKRRSVNQRIPFLRSAENSLPYRFESISLAGGAGDFDLAIDNYAWKLESCIFYRWSTLTLRKRVARPWSRSALIELNFWSDNRNNEKLNEVLDTFMRLFTDRPGNTVRTMRFNCGDHLNGWIEKLRATPFCPKVCTMATSSPLLGLSVPSIDHRQIDRLIEIPRLVEAVRQQKRPVGSTVSIYLPHQNMTFPLLASVLRDCAHLNPKLGIAPKVELAYPVAEVDYRRVFHEKSTDMQCIVFEMEHADLVLYQTDLLRHKQHDELDSYLQTFRVVAKNSVTVCERHDDWLTTVNMNGLSLKINLAQF